MGVNGDSAAVTVTLLRIDATPRCGKLLALAVVEVDVDGVVFRLQGVRLVQRPDGSKAVEAPRYRGPDGRWLPAVVFPGEMAEAVAGVVLEAVPA